MKKELPLFRFLGKSPVHEGWVRIAVHSLRGGGVTVFDFPDPRENRVGFLMIWPEMQVKIYAATLRRAREGL